MGLLVLHQKHWLGTSLSKTSTTVPVQKCPASSHNERLPGRFCIWLSAGGGSSFRLASGWEGRVTVVPAIHYREQAGRGRRVGPVSALLTRLLTADLPSSLVAPSKRSTEPENRSASSYRSLRRSLFSSLKLWKLTWWPNSCASTPYPIEIL